MTGVTELSIVFGTYNRLSTLKITLPRMLESGAGIDLEIIINDGGSTDGTKEWLQKFSKSDNRVKPILSDTLEGVTKAYNRGFKAACGKFVMWLSDDTAPVGTTIADLVKFMKNLDESDLAALPQGTRGFGNHVVPVVNNILCATVGCLYRKTLEKMEYWNMDYPYYAQDLDLSARIWRCGGRVLECKGAKIEHFVVGDWLRMYNCQKYEEAGRIDKFFLMYKSNYGQKVYYMYPAILIYDDITNIEFVSKYINNFKKIFKNIIIHAISSPTLTELCKICGTIEIVQKTDTNNYDFLITKDGFCFRETGKPVIDPCLEKLGFQINCKI